MDYKLINLIKENLTPDLLKSKYRGVKNKNKYYGHCYVASECYYHMSGCSSQVHYVKHDGDTHWYLSKDGIIIDLTCEQFETPPDYTNGKRGFFLTKTPSKRTSILIERVKSKLLS